MILQHATPIWRTPSILEYGLLTRCCRDGTGRIWFHAESKAAWAKRHVAERHHASPEEVALLTVNLPESMLVNAGNGLYYCCQDIQASWIDMVSSRSPALRKLA